MASSGARRVPSETILDKLAKRPVLLIFLTASLSFGLQCIPVSTITSSFDKSWRALRQASTYQFRLFSFRESLEQLVTPPLLLAFVCCGILFIVYTSQQDKGEPRPDDQSHSSIEPKRGLLVRTATLGQSIFAHWIPHASDDEHASRSIDAIGSFDHDTRKGPSPLIADYEQEDNDEVFRSQPQKSISASSEKRVVKRIAKEKQKPSAGAVGTKSKLSRPVTSTSLASGDRSIVDPKLSYFPRSFREDPTKLDKEELNGRFEAYLGNFRRQLQLQKQESLLAKQLDLELKAVKHDSKQNTEASPVAHSKSLDDRNMGTNAKAFLTRNATNDLTEDQVNERIDAFLANFDNGPRPQRQETASSQPSNRHLKSYSLGSSAEESVESVTNDTSAPDLSHTSSQLIRGDSLAIDNQKFESFLLKVRNDLKLQKQESNLRKQVIAHDL
ncbi:hypothetical protein O6H91_19G043800 [Diphasiastrum complanatum]|uniref:Uncharacterized protein n=2 Tax=Diphasiastrum complanatum TaxID=34168 RepID=A0ACC2AUL7_DIPCM|nr:hypothetical protein O6H91_19G043800 [Diphasiastrum complanatum]